MEVLRGDIWQLCTADDVVVVTTNIGWRQRLGRSPGIMGRGLAQQAASRWPWVAWLWGDHCRNEGERTGPLPLRVESIESTACRNLILFPTKPLCVEAPHLSWRSKSDIALITRGLDWLQSACGALLPPDRVLVPLLGCENGRLSPLDVIPLMERRLLLPCFARVEK